MGGGPGYDARSRRDCLRESYATLGSAPDRDRRMPRSRGDSVRNDAMDDDRRMSGLHMTRNPGIDSPIGSLMMLPLDALFFVVVLVGIRSGRSDVSDMAGFGMMLGIRTGDDPADVGILGRGRRDPLFFRRPIGG